MLILEAITHEPGTTIQVYRLDHYTFRIDLSELGRNRVIFGQYQPETNYPWLSKVIRKANKHGIIFGELWTQVIFTAYNEMLQCYCGNVDTAQRDILNYISYIRDQHGAASSSPTYGMNASSALAQCRM